MPQKATSTRVLNATTTAPNGPEVPATGQFHAARRGILIASMISMGITPPAEIPSRNLRFCHMAARRRHRYENPYVNDCRAWGRRIVLEGVGEFAISPEVEHHHFKAALELEHIADELERLEIESRPQSEAPAETGALNPEDGHEPRDGAVLEFGAKPEPAETPRLRLAGHLAVIESLKMPSR